MIVLLGLAGMTVLAWLYTAYLARSMAGEGGQMSMPTMRGWGLLELGMLFVMWAIMMVAMMMPSASPMVLMYTKTVRARTTGHGALPPTGLFVLGYLVAWTGFSALAAAAQWGLHAAAFPSASMASTSALAGGVLLLMAGVFQWTPLKHACLRRCRSPLGFLMTEWRDGGFGAFTMGLRYGLFCLGCCWALMTLLFVTGVMNLFWVAVIAIFVLIEKVVPAGEWLARTAGILLMVYGIAMIFAAVHT